MKCTNILAIVKNLFGLIFDSESPRGDFAPKNIAPCVKVGKGGRFFGGVWSVKKIGGRDFMRGLLFHFWEMEALTEKL